MCHVEATACFTSAYVQNCLPARCFLMGLNERMPLGHANLTSDWLQRYGPTFLQPPSRISDFHILAFLELHLTGKRSTKDADVKQSVTFWLQALVTDKFYAGTQASLTHCQRRICQFWYTRSATHVQYVYTEWHKKWELLKCVVAAMYSWQHSGTGTLSYREPRHLVIMDQWKGQQRAFAIKMF